MKTTALLTILSSNYEHPLESMAFSSLEELRDMLEVHIALQNSGNPFDRCDALLNSLRTTCGRMECLDFARRRYDEALEQEEK